MKKWFIALMLLALFAYGAVRHQTQHAAEQPPAQAPPSAQEAPPPAQDAPPIAQEKPLPSKEPAITVDKDQVYKGNLLLVNKDHPVPPGGVPDEAVALVQHKELIKGFAPLDRTIQLSPSLAQKFTAMVEAAAQDRVNHFLISSGYRDEEEQNRLYREMGADYAMPAGYSEHNLGLALDVGSSQGEMNRAPEGKWLKENAWKYGFILRYPEDKTAITGIKFEPWHFRYVGLPHSAVMQQKNMVLEEYLDFLKEQKSFTTTVEGQTYTISYYPVSQRTMIPKPAGRQYDISGDNRGGVIVTMKM